jgi:hypothetical protein
MDNSQLRVREAYLRLLAAMERSGLEIEVRYTDDEPGCRILRKERGVLYVKDYALLYRVEETQDFEYDWKNILAITDNDELLKELMYDLALEAGLSPDNDELWQWAIENTTAGSFLYEHLNDQEKSAFAERFNGHI